MKRFWIAALTSAMLMGLFMSMAWAQVHLNLGTDDWPPYEYRQDNDETKPIIGFSTEVIRAVFANMDAVIDKIDILPWSRGEKMVFEGNIDALYSTSSSSKRMTYCLTIKNL